MSDVIKVSRPDFQSTLCQSGKSRLVLGKTGIGTTAFATRSSAAALRFGRKTCFGETQPLTALRPCVRIDKGFQRLSMPSWPGPSLATSLESESLG